MRHTSVECPDCPFIAWRSTWSEAQAAVQQHQAMTHQQKVKEVPRGARPGT